MRVTVSQESAPTRHEARPGQRDSGPAPPDCPCCGDVCAAANPVPMPACGTELPVRLRHLRDPAVGPARRPRRVPDRLVHRIPRHPDPRRVRHPHPCQPVLAQPTQPGLIAAALAGVAAAILLPYTPLAAPLGFTPLPASYLPIVATLVVAYLALVEATKRALFIPGDLLRPAPPPTAPAVRHVHRRAARFTTTARRRHLVRLTDLLRGQQRGPGPAPGATARRHRRSHRSCHRRRVLPGPRLGHWQVRS